MPSSKAYKKESKMKEAVIEVLLNFLTLAGLLAVLFGLLLLAPDASAVVCDQGNLNLSPCWPESQVPSGTVPLPGTAILMAAGGWLLFNMRK
jgi:hypothetical protein